MFDCGLFFFLYRIWHIHNLALAADNSSVASTQESAPIGGNSGGLSTQSVPVDCESKQGKDGKTFRNPMWKHFTHLVVNNEEKAQCNYYKKLFVGKSSYGTSHLKQHFDVS